MTARERRWSIRFVDDLSDDVVDRVATFFEKYFPGVFGGPCDPEIPCYAGVRQRSYKRSKRNWISPCREPGGFLV